MADSSVIDGSEPSTSSNVCLAAAREHFGYFLNSTPPIVEQILTHLPMRELNRCAQVCKLWSSVASKLKKRRKQFAWMFWVARPFGRAKKGPVHVIDDHVNGVLNLISSEPKLALMFATNSFFDEQARYIKSAPNSGTETSVIDYLMGHLPADCLLLGTSTDGMIGTSLQCDQCLELENKEGFTCFMLPNIPGLTTYPFVIKDLDDLTNPEAVTSLTDTRLQQLTTIPPEQEVKALVLLCTHPEYGGEAACLVAKTLLLQQNKQMALGGGFVDSLVAPKHLLSQYLYLPHTIGIAFCGESVKAASIVMKYSVRTKDTVRRLIRQLKNCGIPEENSFAFMFACVSRGEAHYGEHNVEAKIFHEEFPKTPLFGFFGNGEIGIDHLPNYKNGEKQEKRKLFENVKEAKPAGKLSFFHSYTTIFVLISIGKTK